MSNTIFKNYNVLSKEQKYHNLFINIAKETAKMSFSTRAKVGCLIVKDNRVIVNSWNGTISGEDNDCEENGVTKNTVVHAEANAILFAAKNGISTNNCKMYATLSPCIECAKMIIQCGIKELFYIDEYRDLSGVEFLKTRIRCEKIE